MPRFVLAASLVAAFVLAACGVTTPPPSQPAVVPSASPIPVVPATPEPADPSATPPVATPAPTVRPTPPPTPSPRPTPPSFTRAERYLVDGIMRGVGDCLPVRSSRLPGEAIAGIDCALIESPAARVGYYMFGTDADMLDAYFARMRTEGIEPDSGGSCIEGSAESAYVPWDPADGMSPYRHGCFVNDAGYGNYRVTVPGAHVYIGLLGRTADMGALEGWVFFGSEDTPSFPTLWIPPFEYQS